MAIKYKSDAFPYVDSGTLPGHVSFMPPTGMQDGQKQFTYHVYGTLDNDYFAIKGRNYPITYGMTAKACIVTKKKSLLSMILGKLKMLKE